VDLIRFILHRAFSVKKFYAGLSVKTKEKQCAFFNSERKKEK
jgi:hypothetical protein